MFRFKGLVMLTVMIRVMIIIKVMIIVTLMVQVICFRDVLLVLAGKVHDLVFVC